MFEQSFALSDGESIYLKGMDVQGVTIPTTLNDLNSSAPLGCVNCHRESGFGSSESGQTFPPVSWYFLGRSQPENDSSRFYPIQNKRQAYTAESFHRILTTGINSNGQAINGLMPKYSLTKEQSDHLIEYLKTIYAGSDPGVDGDVIRIATIVDTRLPQQVREQHLSFLNGLVEMKNGLSRGELRRKQNSPVQKKPQYESYRKWELVTWALPQDTTRWLDVLSNYYQQTSVFAIIRPLVLDKYEPVADFCSSNKIPCFFPSGKNLPAGDFYNYSFRNRAKQYQDYIAKKQREALGRLLFIDEAGSIQRLEKSMKDIPVAGQITMQDLQPQYERFCKDDYDLLVKTGAQQAAVLDKLLCPEQSRLSIKVVSAEETDYQTIINYIGEHKNSDLCWVSDYDQVLKRNLRKVRVNSMTHRFGINNSDDEELAITLLAFGIISESLHQMAGYFSRVYMLELIEHMLNSFPNYSFASSISGAPYQRYIVGPLNEYCQAGARI